MNKDLINKQIQNINKIPKLNINELEWTACECSEDALLFTPILLFKKVSALMSPDGKSSQISIDIVKCDKCGKVPSFIHSQIKGFPEILKAKKVLI